MKRKDRCQRWADTQSKYDRVFRDRHTSVGAGLLSHIVVAIGIVIFSSALWGKRERCQHELPSNSKRHVANVDDHSACKGIIVSAGFTGRGDK